MIPVTKLHQILEQDEKILQVCSLFGRFGVKRFYQQSRRDYIMQYVKLHCRALNYEKASVVMSECGNAKLESFCKRKSENLDNMSYVYQSLAIAYELKLKEIMKDGRNI